MREEKFKDLLLMSPQLNLQFSLMLENWLLKVQKRLQDLSLNNNQQRIIDYLKETALMYHTETNGKCIIKNSLTHEKIAQLTSTNRQEVSGVFSNLKNNILLIIAARLILF